MLALQRQAGNAATGQFLRSMAPPALVVQRQPADVPHAHAGPFTGLPEELQRPIVEYFRGARHVKVGDKLRYDAAEPERKAAAWFRELSARQADGLLTVFNKMAAAGIWRFVQSIRAGKGGSPVDSGEPDAVCLEQEGNSVSVYFAGDGAGLFNAIGSPDARGWQVDDATMALLHSGQQSIRQRETSSGLHVSIGPSDGFDVHVDRHPPIKAGSRDADMERWVRLLRHGREEVAPNVSRKVLGKLLTLPVGFRGSEYLEQKVLPSLHLAPTGFYPGSQVWEEEHWAETKARDPYLLEKEQEEGLGTPYSVGLRFPFGSRR
ncbi:MAG: hypothetical protein ACXWZ1_01810 [Gaiellaceae bacterium]